MNFLIKNNMNIFNRITSNLQSFWSNVYDAFHNAEDPTQTLQYKAVNTVNKPIEAVTSGITNAIQSGQQELESRKQQRQQDTNKKWEEFVSSLIKKWYDKDSIMSTLWEMKKQGMFNDNPWIIEWMSQRLYGSLSDSLKNEQKSQSTDKSVFEKGLYGGWNLVSTVVSAPINTLFGGVIQKWMEQLPDSVKSGIWEVWQAYGQFSEQNPRLAQNIEAVTNLWTSILPFTKTGQAAMNTWVNGVKNIWKSAIETTTNFGKSFGNEIKSWANVVKEKIIPRKINIPEWLSKAEQDALREIYPKNLTPSKLNEAKIFGKVDTWKWIKWTQYTYNPDKLDVEIAKNASPYIKKWASTSDNVKRVTQAIDDEANILEKTIASKNPIIPKKQVDSQIKKAVTEIMDHPEMVGDNKLIAEKLIAKYKSMLNEEWGTALWILRARKRFDAYIKSVKPNAFDSTKIDVYGNTVRSIRNTANDLLDSMITDISAKQSLKKQHLLYKARDMISENKDINKLWKFLDNPYTKAWAAAVWGWTAYNLLSN